MPPPILVASTRRSADSLDFPTYGMIESTVSGLSLPVQDVRVFYYEVVDAQAIPGPAKTSIKLAFDDLLTAAQTLQMSNVMTSLFSAKSTVDSQGLQPMVARMLAGIMNKIMCVVSCWPPPAGLPGSSWKIHSWSANLWNGKVTCTYACTVPGRWA